MYRPNSNSAHQITHNTALEVALNWSPDGSYIVFQMQNPLGQFEIHTLDINTGIMEYITDGGAPAWRP